MRRFVSFALVVLAAAGVAHYFLSQPIGVGPEPLATPIDAAPPLAPAVPGQVTALPGQGITPELMDLMEYGLPIEGCNKRVSEIRAGFTEEELEKVTREAVDVLAGSDDPEYLLAAALIDFNRDDRGESELLSRALAKLPNHPVALWHRMQHCQSESCDRERIVRAALDADPSNGMLWLEIARLHVEEGDWAGAERAMRRAIASSRFDTYFLDYAVLIERGLAASTDFDYPNRVVFGIGVAAAVAIPSFGEVLKACASDDTDAVVWVPMCDELGKSMYRRSRELISTMIGGSYRQVAAERAGDTDRLASLKEEYEALADRYSYRQIRVGASALIENDPAVLRNYLDDFRAHGELGAVDRLVEVAERLRKDETYDQCNFVIRSPMD